LTSSQDDKSLLAELDLGAFDVMSKPVILDAIELVVQLRRVISAAGRGLYHPQDFVDLLCAHLHDELA
jgi:hypothetical protein